MPTAVSCRTLCQLGRAYARWHPPFRCIEYRDPRPRRLRLLVLLLENDKTRGAAGGEFSKVFIPFKSSFFGWDSACALAQGRALEDFVFFLLSVGGSRGGSVFTTFQNDCCVFSKKLMS